MTLPEYKEVIADFLAQQSPPVLLADDDAIWTVVKIAHKQQRGVIWTAGLALSISRSYETTGEHERLATKK